MNYEAVLAVGNLSLIILMIGSVIPFVVIINTLAFWFVKSVRERISRGY